MRRFQNTTWFVTVLALLAASGLTLGCGDDDDGGEADAERARIERGLEISPVPLRMEGLNRELVGLGSYIVNAQGACNDCHTNPPFVPGGDPFRGEPEQINTENFLAGGRAFGPDIVSPNLTPDAQGRPGGLSFEQFESLLRTGREEDGDILQVMPWHIYGKMRERDLRAMYDYLRAIPPAQPGTAPTTSP